MLIDLMWSLAWVASIVAVISTILNYFLMTKKKKKDGTNYQYSQRTPVLYHVKFALMYVILWLRGRKHARAKRSTPQWQSLRPTREHEEMESAKDLAKLGNPELANDTIAFQGADKHGNQLLIRLARRTGGEREVWLVLRLIGEDGVPILLTHTEHPASTVYAHPHSKYAAAGLRCEMREPMRRWRVAYNGWMRIRSQTDHIDLNNDKVVHVKFAFTWSSLSGPVDFNNELHPAAVADALAREKWTQEWREKMQSAHEDRYEQYGQLRGQVSVEDHCTEREVILRGMRDHCYGLRDWTKYARYTANMGYCTDGTFFHVGAVSIPGGTTHLNYGYVGLRNGSIFPISDSSLDLSTTGDNGAPPQFFSFAVRAGGEVYSIRLQVHTTTVVFNGRDWPSKSFLRFMRVQINNSYGEGFSEFEYRNTKVTRPAGSIPSRCATAPSYELQQLSHSEVQSLVIPLGHRAALCNELTGGKGSQLAQLRLQQGQFSVPDGICITSEAFRLFSMYHPNITALITEVGGKSNEISEIARRLREEVERSSLPENLWSLIERQLGRLFGDVWHLERKFAIRSSAIGEDSGDASSAGQMDTILGKHGMDDICTALRACWSSMFSDQLLTYRLQTGQSLTDGCAVVIQEMVPAEVSGVLFTCDPVTSNPAHIVINANFGLGESVVSGAAEPDSITVERSYDNRSLTIVDRQLGSKHVNVVMEENGIREVELSEDASKSCCMSDEQILELSKIGIEIEHYFGDRRDIEWAWGQGRFYILQARPVTTDFAESDYEMFHEFDTPIRFEGEYNTTANVGEVLAGSTTPLGCSVAVNAVDKCVQAMVATNNSLYEFHPTTYICNTIYRNRTLLNLSNTLYNDPNVAKNRAVAELCVIGRPIEDERLEKECQEVAGKFSKKSRLINGIMFAKMLFTASTHRESFAKKIEATAFPYYVQTPADIYQELDKMLELYFESWVVHIKASGQSKFWYHVLVGILMGDEQQKELTPRHYEDIGKMYSSCEAVVSADVPGDLQELAKAVRKAMGDMSTELNSDEPHEVLAWIRQSEACGALSQFLNKHGHRCICEIDLYEPTWAQQPANLMPVLMGIVKSLDSSTGHHKSTLSAAEAVDGLSTQLNNTARRILKSFVVPGARRSVGFREQTKNMAVKVTSFLRDGYRRLGKAFVSERILPELELVFFLTHYELGQLVQQRSTTLITRARRRRKIRSVQAALNIPEIIRGEISPLPEVDETIETGETVQGTAVSAGKVKARVCVCVTLADAKYIQHGDILVASSTDIAWSVYFPLLSGVVTELGGLLSHGAVVAREYGLPCLVSARNATKCFQSGEIALLDSSTGTIAKIHGE